MILKTLRQQYKRKTILLLPNIILFLIIIFNYNTSKLASNFYENTDYNSSEIFSNESVYSSRILTSKMINEQMQILALSKIKLRGNSYYNFLLLLSGDINPNPGPTNYPCLICEKGVRSKGVFCTQCGYWVHPKYEKMSDRVQKIKKNTDW